MSQQEGSFVSIKGVSDWSNMGRLVKLHTCELSPHHDAVIKGDNFVHVSSGNQTPFLLSWQMKIQILEQRSRSQYVPINFVHIRKEKTRKG